MKPQTKKLVTSSIMLALATILSMLKLWEMPWGGSITLFSMLPIILVGFMYGTKWGITTALASSLLQMLLGATMSQAFAGLDGMNIVYMAFLDYIVAFTVLGLGGIFKKLVKNQLIALILGVTVCVLLRYAAHFGSGAILWGDYAEWFFSDPEAFVSFAPELSQNILNSFSGNGLACIYSAIYNGCYMIPELILTIIAAVAFYAAKPLRKLIEIKQ